MIKNFKKRYYISRLVALECLVCTAVTFTSSIPVNAFTQNNLSTLKNNIIYSNEQKSKLLIDDEIKSYKDLDKAQKMAGFKFKLPDYIVDNYDGMKGAVVQKIADNENAVKIYFYNNNDDTLDSWNYSMIISKGDISKAVMEIEKYNTRGLSVDISLNKEDASIKGISGQIVTLTIDYPEKIEGDYKISAAKQVCKYFVWNEDGVNYSVNYNSTFTSEDNTYTSSNISEDNIVNIAKSLKDTDKITNTNYGKRQELSTESPIMMIYDEEDLENAKDIIGFNPKFPVNVKDDIEISQSCVNLTSNSDIENNKLDYDVWIRYERNNDFITLTSSKENKEYNEIKENGYFNTEEYDIEKQEAIPLKIAAEKINLGNREVYRSREENKDNNLILHDYFWEEDGVFYELIVWNNSEDSVDAIAESFINSQEYK